MSKPTITIISPVYNAATYVAECIKSCLNQTLSNIELIFVDDGSSDDSLRVLQDLANADSRLHVLHQENGGAAKARNNALESAEGEFVFFIDADDYIPEKTALERLYYAAQSNHVEIAGGSMAIDRDGELDFEFMHGSHLDSFSREEVVSYADYQYDYDFTRFIYSLSMLNDNGIRFPERRQYEDPVFHVKAMLTADSFATIPDTVYAYRYGHQHRTWDERATLDRLAGIGELLELSSEKHMAKLHQHVMRQFNTETTYVFIDHLANVMVMSKLFETNCLIDCKLLQTIDPDFPDAYLIEPIRIILDNSQRFRYEESSRLGKLYKKVASIIRK